MSINFFNSDCKSSSNKVKFGLCDDPPPATIPAYIDESTESKWIAIVTNDNERSVDFYAIDHCIDLIKENGKRDSRCDGMLHYNNHLISIELKDRGSNGWFSKGEKQISITINHFKRHHNIDQFDKVEAFVCNKQRPLAVTGINTETQRFKNETGFTLKANKNIHIE